VSSFPVLLLLVVFAVRMPHETKGIVHFII
jgi:hypothetical protein